MPLLLIILFLMSCEQEKESLIKALSLNAGLEAGLSSMGALLDEKSKSDNSRVEKCFNDIAELDCLEGQKTKSINNCIVGNQLISGNITYQHSKQECGLFETKDHVIRSMDIKYENSDESLLSVTSNSHTNYQGLEVAGGVQLRKSGEIWVQDILGLRKMRQRESKKIVHDFSIRSNGSLELGKDFSREARLISSGELIVDNNLAKYTIQIKLKDLKYTPDCCYPVSGKLNLTFSGSLKGSASATLNSCGEGTMLKDGKKFDLFFENCE